MKYTKKDIPGIIFKHGDKFYECVTVERDEVSMRLYPSGNIFYNSIEITLGAF